MMTDALAQDPIERLAAAAASTPGLTLLLLFGSRARRDSRADSDWDLGYLAGPHVDHASLLASAVNALGTDLVDLVDLRTASGLLRFRAAQEGEVVLEPEPGAADRFRLEAATFWCDAAPVLQPAYDEVLAGLTR